jgi:hypothetical protein
MVELVKRQVVETRTKGTLADLLRKAETGECVHLCDHPAIQGNQPHWCAYPEGVVVQQGERLLVNGDRTLFEGVFQDWRIAVDDPSRIFLLNKEKKMGPEYSVISDSEGNEICRVESWWLHDWQACSAGVVTCRGERFHTCQTIELNAEKVLARMDSDEPGRWSIIPGTTDILTQGRHCTFYKNGRVQKFNFEWHDLKDWHVSEKGFVFNEEDGAFSIIRWGKQKSAIHLAAQEQLVECDDWRDWQLHPNGIIIKSALSSSANRYNLIVVKE